MVWNSRWRWWSQGDGGGLTAFMKSASDSSYLPIFSRDEPKPTLKLAAAELPLRAVELPLAAVELELAAVEIPLAAVEPELKAVELELKAVELLTKNQPHNKLEVTHYPGAM